MTSTSTAPYGAWPSPISAGVVAAGATPLSSVMLDGVDIYWLAGRAAEGGRTTLMRKRAAAPAGELTPQPFNVRNRVHEYGGGAYAVADGVVVFSHHADNRLYRLAPGAGGAAQAFTSPGRQRFADFDINAFGFAVVVFPGEGGVVGIDDNAQHLALDDIIERSRVRRSEARKKERAAQ